MAQTNSPGDPKKQSHVNPGLPRAKDPVMPLIAALVPWLSVVLRRNHVRLPQQGEGIKPRAARGGERFIVADGVS